MTSLLAAESMQAWRKVIESHFYLNFAYIKRAVINVK